MKIIFFLLLVVPFLSNAQTTQFEYLDTLKKCTVKNFESKFKGLETAVLFFYPKDNLEKLELFKNQVKDLTLDPRFKQSKIIGISHETTVNDKDNMYFESFNISDIQCIIYCTDKAKLLKALKGMEYFELKTAPLPPNYYLIDIKKEEVCVRETRISFFGALIFELLDPSLSDKELLKQQAKKIESMEQEISQLKKELRELQADFTSYKEKEKEKGISTELSTPQEIKNQNTENKEIKKEGKESEKEKKGFPLERKGKIEKEKTGEKGEIEN